MMDPADQTQSGPKPENTVEKAIIEQLSRLPGDVIIGVLRSLDRELLEAALSLGESDNRRETRHPVLREGKIIYHDRTCLMDCVIRDISSSGCRISVESTASLPRSFELQIEGISDFKACETKWRLPRELGVQFIDRE